MNYRNEVTSPFISNAVGQRGYESAPSCAAGTPIPGTPPIQTPQIESGAERVSDARVHLSSLVAELEKRLNPVLRPVMSGEQLAANPREPMSPLAAALYDHASELDELCSRLSSLCDRIEL